MAAIIKVTKLTHVFTSSDGEDSSPALRGVDMEINRGEFVAILGHNGSGKSTLARHFNAMLHPDSGSVIVDGLDTSDETKIIEIRRRVGMVFQNPDNQIVANVVEEDVAFGPENLGVPPDEIRTRVDNALKAVGMYEYRTHAPSQLSGGQKQRVAIAGALAMLPDCIVLDEPTAMLDPRGREDVINIIRRLRDDFGVTVVLITHHMDEAINCDRIFVMSDGIVVKSGTPREIFSDVALIRSVGLDVPDTVLLMNGLNERGFNLPLDALETDECAASIKKCLSTEVGEKTAIIAGTPASEPGRSVATSDKIIETENVFHTYSAGTPFESAAIRGIGFEALKGEYIGIIGHTGSGKSTFVQHLNGLLKPDSGKITVGGQDIHESKEHTRKARFRVGLVFQFPEYQLFEETVYKDIAFGPKNMGLSAHEIDERVRESARFVGLPEEMLEKSPFELSGGYRRRAAIAGVIAMRPEVLILDEPTAGLDPHGRDELMENIDNYRLAQGATVIVVTHSMEEVARRAERVYVFEDGVIAMRGTPTEVFRNGERLYSMGLGVPKAAVIADKLRALGVPLSRDIYTTDEILNAVTAIRERGDYSAS